jgi:hypothetical protein
MRPKSKWHVTCTKVEAGPEGPVTCDWWINRNGTVLWDQFLVIFLSYIYIVLWNIFWFFLLPMNPQTRTSTSGYGEPCQAITCWIVTSYLPLIAHYLTSTKLRHVIIFLATVKTWNFINNYIISNHQIWERNIGYKCYSREDTVCGDSARTLRENKRTSRVGR